MPALVSLNCGWIELWMGLLPAGYFDCTFVLQTGYYLAGDLVLEDPRGMVPPFGNRVIHSPKVGDIVLFPSWLVHHVSPSCGTAEVGSRRLLNNPSVARECNCKRFVADVLCRACASGPAANFSCVQHHWRLESHIGCVYPISSVIARHAAYFFHWGPHSCNVIKLGGSSGCDPFYMT